MISSRLLKRLLEPENIEGNVSQRVHYKSQGPGHLDTWLLFEGNEHCWQQRETTPFIRHKKKIIFCHGLLDEYAPNPLELNLLSALIHYYDVYLWPGPRDVDFASAKALNSSADFWGKCVANPALQQEVKDSLAQQGIAAEDYIILDSARYAELLQKLERNLQTTLITPQRRADELDLTTIPVTDEETLKRLKASVDAASIKTIKTIAPTAKEIGIILQCFRQIETLELKNIEEAITPEAISDLQDNLLQTGLSHLNLAFNECAFPEEFKFQVKTNFKRLSISNAIGLGKVVFSNSDNAIEELEISCRTLNELIITHDRIKRIKITDCPLMELILASSAEELEIFNCNLQDVDLSECPHLKRISFKGCRNLEKVDFSELHNLERLNLGECENLSEFDLSTCERLKHLQLSVLPKSSRALENINSWKLPLLETLEIDFCKLELYELDLTRYENLKELSLLSNPFLMSVKLPTTLVKLAINTSHFSPRDLFACHNLKYLTLDIERFYVFEGSDFSQLTALEELKIIKPYGKEEERDITIPNFKLEQCQRLKSIKIERTNIEIIQLSQLPILEKIEIHFNNELTEFNTIACPQLKSLIINGCNLSKPIELSHPNVLESMNISGSFIDLDLKAYSQLKHFVVSLSSLTRLEFDHLQALEDVSISNCFELENLTAKDCEQLKEVSIYGCSRLRKIDFSQLPSMEMLIAGADDLTELKLSTCSQLKKMEIANCSLLQGASFPALEDLKIKDSSTLSSLDLKQYPQLRRLRMEECLSFEGLDFPQLQYLEEMQIEYSDLSQLNENALQRLRHFIIRKCDNVEIINSLRFPYLEELKIEECSDLKQLNLTAPQLKLLRIEDCPLTTFRLSQLTSLEKLEMPQGCKSQAKLEKLDLSYLPRLKEVTLAINSRKIDFSHNPELRQVDVVACVEKVNFDACPKLRTLMLRGANQVNLDHIEDCQQLRRAFLSCDVYYVLTHHTFPPDCQIKMETPWSLILNPPAPSMEGIIRYDPAQLKLHRQNENNPVSFFSIDDSPSVDRETGKSSSAFTANGPLSVTLNARDSPNRDHYRIRIFDSITIFNGKLRYHSDDEKSHYENISTRFTSFDEKDVEAWQNLVAEKEDWVLGYLNGDLQPGVFYPLPTQQVMPTQAGIGELGEIVCNPMDAVELFWHAAHQQYYVKLKTEYQQAQRVAVLYLFKKNLAYDLEIDVSPITDKPGNLLPRALIDRLHRALSSLPSLAFLFDEKRNPLDKLKQLIQYCTDFKDENLSVKRTDHIKTDDIETLCAIIKEQKGVCRHRAQAFMILARYIGVPARMVLNEQHAFCEVPNFAKDGKTWEWHRVDMGGSFRLDLTPAEKRQNIFGKIKRRPLLLKPLVKEESQLSRQRKDTVEQAREGAYYHQFTALLQESEVKSIDALLKKGLNPPLISLADDQTPLDVNKHIIQELKVEGDANYLYIHRPEDFALYLHPYQLHAGQRHQIDGPLADLIKKGGTLVVNWSTFTSTEIASYKSILDSEPTLLGESVTKNLTVIGLAGGNADTCSAFLSRCTPYILHADFFGKQPRQKAASAEGAEVVDLFKRTDWREHLLGKIILKGNSITLEEGPLVKAIRENRPLIIHNAPENDKDFELILHRVRDERKLLYNGELLQVPDDVSIEISSISHADALTNVHVHTEDKRIAEQDQRNPVYLGLHNFHECFEQLKIDDKGKAHILPGYLDIYDPNQHVFYFTDSIPRSDWHVLLAYIQEKYPNKLFDFILAPAAMIEHVAASKASPSLVVMNPQAALTSGPAAVVISNDPDYYSEQLLASSLEQTMIVNLTPQTTFSDLIFTVKILPQAGSAEVDFSYQEQGVLQALRAGKTVILNGECAPALYQQLLPLFSTQPGHIYCNGERIEVQGQLRVVMSKTASAKLPLIEGRQCDYTFDDYLSTFPETEKIYARQINAFYDWAQKMPHRGLGLPEAPTLSHKHLERLVRATKERKLHEHNPVKGLFHYDYPKNSEDYSYLNVIAKYLLCAQDQTSVREDKLRQFIKHLPIKELKDHTWQMLNCFRGAALRELLGDNLDYAIDPNAAYPAVTLEVQKRLWNKIAPYVDSQELISAIRPSRVEKRAQKLRTLLEDINTPLIVLKGPPGVGKTYTVRELTDRLGFACYQGEEDIIKWIEDKSPKHKVLLLDEANMASPGTWDFLKGLSQNKRTVYYQGKEYPLTAHHKIIATGNPESYPGRYYHSLFQEYGEALIFEIPEDDFLEKVTLKLILEPKNLYDSFYPKALLHAYHLIREYNPVFVYSNRDLENLAQRFITMFITIIERNATKNTSWALWKACIGEFAGTIHDPEKRRKFIDELAQYFKIEETQEAKGTLITLNAAYSIPNEKAYLVEAIEQDLALRERILTEAASGKQAFYYKQGVLIEGDSGLGKSTLLKALLEKNGFTKENQDTQKNYYEISVGDPQAVGKTLLKAFNEGSAVILDELNLDPSLEKLLNQLLTGTDMSGKKPEKPGFMIFSSQNPGYFKGRKSLSQALRNRLHVLYMEPYSSQALADIARSYNVTHPEAFVEAYQESRAKYRNAANMRTFFTAVKREGNVRDKKLGKS